MYAFRRVGGGEKIVVLYNFLNCVQEYPLDLNVKCLFSSDGREYSGGNVQLSPFTAVYYLES